MAIMSSKVGDPYLWQSTNEINGQQVWQRKMIYYNLRLVIVSAALDLEEI